MFDIRFLTPDQRFAAARRVTRHAFVTFDLVVGQRQAEGWALASGFVGSPVANAIRVLPNIRY